ncbi:MAG TPA: hypothetical protein VMB73_23965 [Acetobacteraceae bacterium]|jgi:hypothetical protein|nr:hypothetical protein [Acetobacteraceae bacterium]
MPRRPDNPTLRRAIITALPLLALSLFTCIGLLTMTSSSAAQTKLTWEWPAGRRTDRFLAVKLTRVAKEGGGLFGIRRSPSLADSLPDAKILEGSVMQGINTGEHVSLRAPGAELPRLAAGDRAAFGLVEDRICICVLQIPADITEDRLGAWLSRQSCGE